MAHRSDPIRIVPVADRLDRAAPAGQPQLTYRGGALLANVEVFTFFWGAGWQQDPAQGLVDRINGFFDAILTSDLMDQLAEYSTGPYAIGHGSRTGSLTVPDALGAEVTDDAVRTFIRDQLTSNSSLPQPGPNSLYFVYLPPGVDSVSGNARSCQTFCGYHDDAGGNLYYAVMPYPGCSGCLGGLSDFDSLTSTSSHELCEAITDPTPGQGWYDDANGEIGDICAWQTRKSGQYTVQLEWSNQSGSCV